MLVHFRGETPISGATEPFGFIVLGTALNPNTGDISFFTETPTFRLARIGGGTIQETIRELLNTSTFSSCEPPPCTPPRRCIWKTSISRTPQHCRDDFFSYWCLVQLAAVCSYKYDGYADSRIMGNAFAEDNCVGCVANAECVVLGRAYAKLMHETICGPCEWQKVNANSKPFFTGKVEISSSYGFGGDNAALLAGLINVYISGGGCQLSATALGGCQVGYQSPQNVSLGAGVGPDGRSFNFEVTLTWNGSDSASCGVIGNGLCHATPGDTITAQVVTSMKLRARANGGISNLLALWAKAYIEESSADTVIGGMCPNASRTFRVD